MPTFSSITSHRSRSPSPVPDSSRGESLHAADSTPVSTGTRHFISGLWTSLKKVQLKLSVSHYLVSSTIPFNNTGVECACNDSTIKVVPDAQEAVDIHAHTIAIKSCAGDGEMNERHYAVGQSPPEATCIDFVLQGIQSGQGLFQFVSRKAHHDPTGSSVEPMSATLTRMMLNGPVCLDDRYSLTCITPTDVGGVDGRQFTLTIADRDNPGKPFALPLMQAGLKFTGKLLRVREIERASELMGPCTTLSSTLPGTQQQQCDPLILSTAGHGRNAVLMTYREIARQIEEGVVSNEDGLRNALHVVISAGRKIRSPQFVHSQMQLEELYQALQEKLPARAVPVTPGTGATAQNLRSVTFAGLGERRSSSGTATGSQDVTNPAAVTKIIDARHRIDRFPIPNSEEPAPEVLEARHNEKYTLSTTNHLTKTLRLCNLQLKGKSITLADPSVKNSWISSSEHDAALLLAIRSMRIYGRSIEATSLFNVLEKNINSTDKVERITIFRKALLMPIRLSPDDAVYESYLFPCKTLPESTLEKMSQLAPDKAALFGKQNALYLAHRNDSTSSEIDVPLKAFFSKEAAVNSYRKGEHLDAKIGDLTRCSVRSQAGIYFASEDNSQGEVATSSQQKSSPPVYEVHVDFANSSLGGGWQHEGCFAQEEIAFIENAGLGAVASYAREENSARLTGFTNGTMPHGQRHYGKNFLTRRPDHIPSPILIEGAERVAHFSSYGGGAKKLERSVLASDSNYKKTEQCVPTNWLAIAAPNYRHENVNADPLAFWKVATPEKIREAFLDLFSTAHAGFTMAKNVAGTDRKLRINTGQLGCGVFGNSLAISTAAQMLAAKIVGVEDIVFHDYSDTDDHGKKKKIEAKKLFTKIQAVVSEKLMTASKNNLTVEEAINLILKSRRFAALI